MKQINVGILAYGMSGKVFHAPFFEIHTGFNFSAVVERTKKTAQQDYPAIMSYNSVDELLNDANIDLVVVNTPNYLHYEHTKAALEKGKHVLVEKPFVANVQQAKELFDLAESLDKKLFVYQNRRWDSDFLAVKNVIESGKLGKLSEFHIRFERYRKTISPKAFKEESNAASGLMYDLGPHLLDQVIHLFGEPLSYHKFLGKNREGTQVDDYFFIQLAYPDSLNVTVSSNLLVVAPQAAFTVNGTNGSFIKVRADVQESELMQGIKPSEKDFGIEDSKNSGILTLLNDRGERIETKVASKAGNYFPIFEAVYQTVVNDVPFPISKEEILIQLSILSE